MKEFTKKLKNLGIGLYKKAKKEVKSAKSATERTLLADKLRRRFNLENPFKFIITHKDDSSSLIDKYLPRHAKRYNEDDIFVFYGDNSNNSINKGDIVKDLSDETKYEVIEMVDVTLPVKLDGKVYDVPCVAAYGRMI